MIYPAGLTRGMRVLLGAGVLVLTLAAYTAVLMRRTRGAVKALGC